ncbi:hypothetical protein BO78DRAFT_422924 [Aspergillus sclerotiicarbonarius CBS 121057]|uniref:Uncharacterized protein n=1 Tax=Aspergillus sclerotiicarbonarius (strain CBS 121057 / IBT 28362) TaxID=1448318 RepID=A0A319DW51_ASPSB|nr:hypothetical protein BO78DRAFT_422924 [Aspergillus sclerotiicarbonarius CBS 121057]
MQHAQDLRHSLIDESFVVSHAQLDLVIPHLARPWGPQDADPTAGVWSSRSLIVVVALSPLAPSQCGASPTRGHSSRDVCSVKGTRARAVFDAAIVCLEGGAYAGHFE